MDTGREERFQQAKRDEIFQFLKDLRDASKVLVAILDKQEEMDERLSVEEGEFEGDVEMQEVAEEVTVLWEKMMG